MKASDITVGHTYLVKIDGFSRQQNPNDVRGYGRLTVTEPPRGGMVTGTVDRWKNSATHLDAPKAGATIRCATRFLRGPYAEMEAQLKQQEAEQHAAEQHLKRQVANANALRQRLREHGAGGSDMREHRFDIWTRRSSIHISASNYSALADALGVRLPYPDAAAKDAEVED